MSRLMVKRLARSWEFSDGLVRVLLGNRVSGT
jgi:hypothetical protein